MPSPYPTIGVNDLQSQFPDIAAQAYEWDPSLVSTGSKKKLKWICEKGHQYFAVVYSRTSGSGCPVCAGKQVLVGFNDLKTKFPDIAAEAYGWDPTTVTVGTQQKMDWICDKGHQYSSTVANRTSGGRGCPICSGRQVLVGFNDLKTKFPDIAAEAYGWDPTTVSIGSTLKKSWICPKGHQFSSTVNGRTSGTGCPYCSGHKVWVGFNDLKTKFPDIAAEADGWDPTTVTAATSQKMDWICDKGHQYSSTVANRTSGGTGCSYCAGQKVLIGFNDLKTKFPDIAAEAHGWDPTKFSVGANTKMNWICEIGHQYSAKINHRTSGSGCPVCSGRQVLEGFNDLKSKFPDIASEAYKWDPATVSAGTHQKMNWICDKGHQYSSSIANRTSGGKGCPYCGGQKVLIGFNDLKTKFPDIAAEAYGWDPTTVTIGSTLKKSWICPKGHQFSSTVNGRTSGTGCPYCADYGFNIGKDAWFYLMQRPGEQQLGITNSPHTRFKTHERNGWQLIEHVGPVNGKKIFDLEAAFKIWLRDSIGLIEGTRENWSTIRMEVHSLAELKARSGIDTDLF
jgi:hypothetical protein